MMTEHDKQAHYSKLLTMIEHYAWTPQELEWLIRTIKDQPDWFNRKVKLLIIERQTTGREHSS